ncbi:MAG: CerR family C-terminal domain-containing protein [Isosphaeraceae bacterium]|jgi:AcrR family transcriptional regulator
MVVQDPTKSRLLEGAGEEFAEKGFELARVRAICDRAGANLAAINYHFGDKEHLYVEVLREAHRCGLDPREERFDPGLSPAERLRAFIRHFLGRVLSMNQPADWRHRLMMREMLSPTPFSEVLVREMIRPRFELMRGLMREICPEADDRRLNALVFSVIGQCLHYKMARRVTERLIGEEGYRALDLDYLTDHITAFCLAALGMGPTLNQAGEPSSRDETSAHVREGSPCTGSP